ncbi:MAG: HEAT repeat domain-containing protein [Polyangiales bacterium]
MLSHPSPVVRGYLVRHIASTWPEHTEALYASLRDTTSVLTLEGCVGSPTTISGLTMAALCQNVARTNASLRRAALDTTLDPAMRASAFRCPASSEAPYRTLAVTLLNEAEPTVRAAALHWFACTAQPSDLTRELPFATDASAEARIATASALGRVASAEALTALRVLLRDSDARVCTEAARAMARQPATPQSELRSILEGPDFDAAVAVASVGVCMQAPSALLAAERVLRRPNETADSTQLLDLALPWPPDAARMAVARRLLSSPRYLVANRAIA